MPHAVSPSDHTTKMSEPYPSSPPIAASSIMDPILSDAMDTSQDGAREIVSQVDLDAMFSESNAIDEDDDEYAYPPPPSSGVAKKMADLALPSSPPPLPAKIDVGSRFSDPDIMLAFYRRLFPFRILYQWLNHGVKPCADMANRELALTLQGDIYLRYQSYTTGDLLRKDILRQNPARFEIGPVYNTNPRDRKSMRKASAFRPVAKELCFDLDLTDYDDIRTCCTEANICLKCWQWATMAVKVVDTCLREDFGFEHIMWVYSGRRGVHGWVCDKRARIMNDEKRRAIAGYLGVVLGVGDKRVNVRRPLHPHIERSLQLLAPHFSQDILRDQDPWRTTTQADKLLKLIPDKPLASALKKKWDSAPGRSSNSKWSDIDTVAASGISKDLDKKALLEAKRDIVLEYTYPRLDIEVSKKLNHLLKSPFVVHPKTGRVCVPIPLPPRQEGNENWSALESFNPLTVPTVIDILNEIDEWDSKEVQKQSELKEDLDSTPVNGTGTSSSNKIQDYEKTSIKPYVAYFKSFVADLIKSESRSVKRERGDDGDDATSVKVKSEAMEF